jgi:hypothetical protein
MRIVRVALVLFAAFAAAGGCSSDPNAPLGSEFVDDGLIHPDSIEVVQDTVRVAAGDASFAVSDFLFKATSMELGRRNGIESWPVLRLDFSTAGADTLRTVRSARLSLSMTSESDTLRALFIALGQPLEESDTLKTFLLADTIPDSTLTRVDRVMRFFPRTYTLPPRLVQDWIRGDAVHNGIAVVLDDTTTTKRLSFGAKENADSGVQPFLRVFFTSGDESTYRTSADGTFVRDVSATENLRLSDGGARRVYIPVDLSVFDPRTLVHEAKLMLHIVPGSFVGEDFLVTLYAPDTRDAASPGILTGTPATSVFVDPDSSVVVMSIRSVLSSLLSKGYDEYPLVLRYASEGSSIRRVQFFSGSAPDSLKPAVTFTYSTAPKFGE